MSKTLVKHTIRVPVPVSDRVTKLALKEGVPVSRFVANLLISHVRGDSDQVDRIVEQVNAHTDTKLQELFYTSISEEEENKHG